MALKSEVKGVKLSPRTLADYREAFGTRDAPGPVREYWAPPGTPLDVTPDQVQQFLRDNAEAGPARARATAGAPLCHPAWAGCCARARWPGCL